MSDLEKSIAMRVCTFCKVEKLNDEFYAGRGRQCKECVRLKMQAHREKEEVQQRAKEYKDRPEVKERAKEREKTPERKNAPSQLKKWAEGIYKTLHLKDSDY